jgi:hypothetical protein
MKGIVELVSTLWALACVLVVVASYAAVIVVPLVILAQPRRTRREWTQRVSNDPFAGPPTQLERPWGDRRVVPGAGDSDAFDAWLEEEP